ncbi:MAG: tyrosine-type recombinase/integrase [Prevotella sp.]|nr:tyrosine-type recombinase/integrase [Prevotella sp.]
MIRTAIIYNHRGRFSKDGTAPVEVRVTIARRAYYINTGVSVRPREWKFGQIVDRYNSDDLNERVRIMLQRVDRVVNERLAKESESEINFEDVRKMVFAPDSRRKVKDAEDMVAWMADEISKLGVRHGTMLHYKVSVAVLAESGIMRKWSDLSVENVHRWDAYLHSIQKHRTDAEVKAGKPIEYISQATVRNYHKDIKALLGRALKFGLIAANPYDRMRGEIKRGDVETVEFLTKDELARIEGLTLIDGSMLATARDMFVFQAYTGMAFSDMQAFSLEKCRRDGDRWLMAGQRVKTGVTYYVRLLPQVLAIAERYGGELPKMAVQVYNRNLKKIAEATGITKRLTSHVGRHTFATWALHEGVPIERVSKMLGHAKVTQTQRYAKVLAEDVFGEFDRLGGPPQ